MPMLTPHFSLEEFIVSETATRQGIDNTPDSPEIRGNILRTAHMLEQVRAIFDKEVIITSGYRCRELNAAVGGSSKSAHMEGLAADIIVPAYGRAFDVCQALSAHLEDLGIDQLIYEYTWTHIGLADDAPRHQMLTLLPGGGYGTGIRPRT